VGNVSDFCTMAEECQRLDRVATPRLQSLPDGSGQLVEVVSSDGRAERIGKFGSERTRESGLNGRKFLQRSSNPLASEHRTFCDLGRQFLLRTARTISRRLHDVQRRGVTGCNAGLTALPDAPSASVGKRIQEFRDCL